MPGTITEIASRMALQDMRLTAVFFFAYFLQPGFAAAPRAEFPQPQFERADWLTLNGDWDFAFDDSNAGMDGHWYAHGHKLDRKITVPFCFESKLSGIADTS